METDGWTLLIYCIVALVIISFVCIRLYEYRHRNDPPPPPLCKPGDYLLGHIIKKGFESVGNGFYITELGDGIKGEIQEYRKDVNCIKLNNEWHSLNWQIGAIHVDEIIKNP
jgi:hypothetical protein